MSAPNENAVQSVDTGTPIPERTDAPLPPDQNPVLAAGRLGDYRIVRLIGHGGYGRVYEAADDHLGRRVAIKVLHDHLALDDRVRGRFLREARALAAVRHDHIVEVYHVGQHNGRPFLVMPLLVGRTLDARMKAGPVPYSLATAVVRQVAEALSAAHACGLIHRDVKPANIWLEEDADGTFRRARLLDFGLTRGPAAGGDGVSASEEMIGTPAYMSPEQAYGQPTDHRSDLFSLGVVLYELLAGSRPFTGDSAMHIMMAICRDPHRPLITVAPETPAAVAYLVERLLAKNPDDRFATATAVVPWLTDARVAVERKFSLDPTPTEIGPYRVIRELGRWEYGAHYESRDAAGHPLHLKVYGPRLDWTRRDRERLFRDCQRSWVPHPGLVRFHEFGVHMNVPYSVSSGISGRTMAEAIRNLRPSVFAYRPLFSIAAKLARILAAVHAAGRTHSAVVPVNVWIEGPAERVKSVVLADLGMPAALRKAVGVILDDPDGGHNVGRSKFWAPELLDGDPHTAACDMFSFGCLLYTAGTGTDPVADMSAVTRLCDLNREISQSFSHLVHAALWKNPAERITADEFVRGLSKAHISGR